MTVSIEDSPAELEDHDGVDAGLFFWWYAAAAAVEDASTGGLHCAARGVVTCRVTALTSQQSVLDALASVDTQELQRSLGSPEGGAGTPPEFQLVVTGVGTDSVRLTSVEQLRCGCAPGVE